jgi:hypothetical protein
MSFDMVKFANTLMAGPTPELGLNLDMLDADRLDVIAAQVTERDAAYLRDLAQRVRLEVREVLELRANQK